MAFQVDAILSSVSELEKEKAGKEVILKELTSQRLKLQNDLQNVRDKHSKVTIMHTQSEENLKLNEQKSLELDGLVNNQERVNENKRSTINKLTKEMETDSSAEQDELSSFEDTLIALTSKFRSAVSFYGSASLEEQLEVKIELQKKLKLKFAENQVKLADITEKLKNAESTTTVPDDVNIIDEDSQEMTLVMWRKSIELYNRIKEYKMKKRLMLETQLHDLKSNLQLLKQQI